jgi:hypothetical protein
MAIPQTGAMANWGYGRRRCHHCTIRRFGRPAIDADQHHIGWAPARRRTTKQYATDGKLGAALRPEYRRSVVDCDQII